jgi:hypothetical protein
MTRIVTTKSGKPAKPTRAERRRIELDALLDDAMWKAAADPRSRRLVERIAIDGPRKKIEIYSAGCRVCRNVEAMVRRIVGTHHDVEVLDMHKDHVARQAQRRGVRSVPSVVVDGRLTPCRTGSRTVDEAILRSAIAS